MSRSGASMIRPRARANNRPADPGVDGPHDLTASATRRTYDALRAGIRSGELGPDEALVENVLMRSLETSRGAVRRALQMLADEGLVVRRPRVGTRVVGEILSAPLFDEIIPSSSPDRQGDPAKRLVAEPLERRIYVPNRLVKDRLELDDDEQVVLIEQLLLIDDQPVGVRTDHFSANGHPQRVFDGIARSTHHPRPFPEVFDILYGEAPGASEVAIEAVPCEARASALLHVAEGAPILLREILRRDGSGTRRSISHTHLRGDRLALVATSPGV